MSERLQSDRAVSKVGTAQVVEVVERQISHESPRTILSMSGKQAT